MATMDESGRVKLVGRTKEMIIKGGENIYPKEIEEILFTHPRIHSAAVITRFFGHFQGFSSLFYVQVFGLPHQRYGETVSCWIKLRDPNEPVTEQEIKQFCKDKMAYFKVPDIIMFEEQFPLTPSGKVQKFKIREISCKKLGIPLE